LLRDDVRGALRRAVCDWRGCGTAFLPELKSS